MAAGIVEPEGNKAGRVTLVATLVSLLPPVVTVLVVICCYLLDILNAEVAAAVILGVLVSAGLTTGTVFTAAKRTPTDQARLIWGSAPVADVVTPVAAAVAAEPDLDPVIVPEPAESPVVGSLADEVAAVRAPAHRA